MSATPNFPTPRHQTLIVRKLGLQAYEPTWQSMQAFSAKRNDDTLDELWLLQHTPVFTLGLNAKREHLLKESGIPLIQVDRGGQVTYHGPGQLIAYLLIDLARRKLGVHDLVIQLEQAVINLLADIDITATGRRDAPGVYVNNKKLAALGLRVRKGRSYHGLSLNIDMDLAPFANINPCGYPGLQVTQLSDLGINLSIDEVSRRLESHLAGILGYTVRNDPRWNHSCQQTI